jgi:acetoin utilization protein AcuB
MLVGERMSHPVVHIPPTTSVPDALALMRQDNIRRTPVIDRGQLVGIVSEKDLIHASASSATSLSVWELNYLLAKIQVREVMTREVITVSESTPIEDAARIMADNKIGGLPVMRGETIVGIITETDLFKILLELMGAREPGVRVSVLVPDRPGQLAGLTQAVANLGGNIISLGTFSGEDSSNREVTMKVRGLAAAKIQEVLEPLVERLMDLRENRATPQG